MGIIISTNKINTIATTNMISLLNFQNIKLNNYNIFQANLNKYLQQVRPA